MRAGCSIVCMVFEREGLAGWLRFLMSTARWIPFLWSRDQYDSDSKKEQDSAVSSDSAICL